MSDLPPHLATIVEDFRASEGQDKLEYLLYLSETLPPLPDWLAARGEGMQQVHECMTPVFILAQSENGRLNFFFDVPDQSPTVRGFAAILAQGLNGLSPEQILQVPSDLYLRMGLNQVLSLQRANGLSAILAYMKQLAISYLPSAG